MARRVAICLLAMLLPIVLFAGTSGKIAGSVVDKNTGAPLAGVNIIVTGGGYNLGAATDLDGYYSILNVPVGTYTVRSSYIGYKEIVYNNVAVSLDLTTELNFEMERTTLEFEQVVVTAE
ncbi:MAG: carboxypeptidase-like regulatory domain-containing protein, partial [Candidatus Marinimicrobia bacterium]|nr:carboxypeptidase-like regulatory domain-containing protein [Candidatus Neomarinimicrobiota bacterium]